MKVKDFKTKVDASIEVPDVLEKINDKRDRSYTYTPQVKSRKPWMTLLKVGIGFAAVVIACLIIIPLMPFTHKNAKDMAFSDDSTYANNPSGAQEPEIMAPTADDFIDEVYQAYSLNVQSSDGSSNYTGELSINDIDKINQYVVDNKIFTSETSETYDPEFYSAVAEEIIEEFDYSEEYKDDISLVVEIIDNK